MDKSTDIQSHKQETPAEIPMGTREHATASLLQASFDLRGRFVRQSHYFIVAKEAMEADLDFLRNKFGEEHASYKKLDLTIENLVKFYNEADRIFNDFDHLFRLLKVQNTILEAALNGAVIRDEKSIRKTFLDLDF